MATDAPFRTSEELGLHPDVIRVTGRSAAAVGSSFRFPVVVLTPQTFQWELDTKGAERRRVAREFARVVRNMRGVRSVWLEETVPDLKVLLVLREPDLDRELECRGIFIDLVSDRLDVSVGELRVYAESENPPGWLFDGAEALS